MHLLRLQEDIYHLWWTCPRWAHLRNPVLAVMDLDAFPRGFLTNGLALDDVSAAFASDAQRMFVAIFRERYLGEG